MSIDTSIISAFLDAEARVIPHSFDADLNHSLGHMLCEQESIARQLSVLDLRELAGFTHPAQACGLSPEVLSQVDYAQSAMEEVQAFGWPPADESLVSLARDQVRALGRPSVAGLSPFQAENLRQVQCDATKALGGSALMEAISSVRETSSVLRGVVEALEASTSTALVSLMSQVREDELAIWRTFLVQEEWDWLERVDEADDLREAVLGAPEEADADPSAEDVAHGEILMVCGAARVRLRSLAKRFDLVAFSEIGQTGTEADEVLVVCARFPTFAAQLAEAAMPFLRLYKMLCAPVGGTRCGVESITQSQLLELAGAAESFDEVLCQVERLIAS